MTRSDWDELGIDETINTEGLRLIKEFEGFSSRPYLDPVGIPTIGYGSIRDENGQPITMAHPPISEAMATKWLMREVEKAARQVHDLISVPLTSNQHSALVSFVYNLGAGALGRSTLRKKLNRGDYEGAAGEFHKWCKAGRPLRVLPGLVRRRAAEMELFIKP